MSFRTFTSLLLLSICSLSFLEYPSFWLLPFSILTSTGIYCKPYWHHFDSIRIPYICLWGFILFRILHKNIGNVSLWSIYTVILQYIRSHMCNICKWRLSIGLFMRGNWWHFTRCFQVLVVVDGSQYLLKLLIPYVLRTNGKTIFIKSFILLYLKIMITRKTQCIPSLLSTYTHIYRWPLNLLDF